MSCLTRLIGLFCLTLLPTSFAFAGFVVQKEVRSSDGMTSRAKTEKIVEYYDPDAGKFAMQSTILRFDTGEMIITNHEQKNYYRNTVSGYCRDIDTMVQEITSSPEYRQAEQMMKQMRTQYGNQAGQQQQMPKPVLRRVGPAKVAGFSAEHFQVKVGSEVENEVWLSNDSRLDKLDWEKNAKLRRKAEKFERQINECMKKLSQMSPGAEVQEDPLEDRSAFELQRKDSFVEVTTVAIERRSIPASRFEPPPGYRKVSMKEAMAFSMNQGGDSESSYGGDRYPADAPAAYHQEPAQEKGMLEKDVEDIREHAEREAHDQTKNAVEDEISDQVRQGVKGLMKLFGQ
jgi:hypothetical protein